MYTSCTAITSPLPWKKLGAIRGLHLTFSNVFIKIQPICQVPCKIKINMRFSYKKNSQESLLAYTISSGLWAILAYEKMSCPE